MRPLEPEERALLDLLLRDEVEGAAALRLQAVHVTGVEPDCACGCPSIKLHIDKDAAPSAGVGYRDVLECVYFDEPRLEWPRAADCDVVVLPSD